MFGGFFHVSLPFCSRCARSLSTCDCAIISIIVTPLPSCKFSVRDVFACRSNIYATVIRTHKVLWHIYISCTQLTVKLKKIICSWKKKSFCKWERHGACSAEDNNFYEIQYILTWTHWINCLLPTFFDIEFEVYWIRVEKVAPRKWSSSALCCLLLICQQLSLWFVLRWWGWKLPPTTDQINAI